MRWFSKSEKQITISTETIIKVIALSVSAVILLKLIGEVSHQLTLIGVSAFLALALNPAVNWLTSLLKSKSRVRATGVAYLTVLTLLISFMALVVPPLVRQTADFISDVPRIINDFQQQDTAIARFIRAYDLDKQLDEAANDFSSRFSDFGQPVLNTASRVGGTIVSIITVLVLTFMMLIEGPLWYERVMSLQPKERRAHRNKLAKRMYRVITGYVNGQVLIAAIAAGFALITLLIASTVTDSTVNAVALAGIVFIFGLIPLIGNILAATVVVLFSLFESGTLALIMAVYFILYQQIENATLQPYIQSRSNQLTPLIVFIAALLGAGIGGLLGALAAIPIAGCIRILLEDWLNKKFPNQETVEESKA